MRTVKFTWRSYIDRDNDIEIETEVIVDDNDDGRQAGIDAFAFARNFLAGLGEEATND